MFATVPAGRLTVRPHPTLADWPESKTRQPLPPPPPPRPPLVPGSSPECQGASPAPRPRTPTTHFSPRSCLVAQALNGQLQPGRNRLQLHARADFRVPSPAPFMLPTRAVSLFFAGMRRARRFESARFYPPATPAATPVRPELVPLASHRVLDTPLLESPVFELPSPTDLRAPPTPDPPTPAHVMQPPLNSCEHAVWGWPGVRC
jgi:hypothetical protein